MMIPSSQGSMVTAAFAATGSGRPETMTASNDNRQTPVEGFDPRDPDSIVARPEAIARRRLMLRGAAAAVPTILTLHSGSAVAARSSFLISKASGAPVDGAGRNMCLDLRSVKDEIAPNVYDLGDPPTPEVTYIRTTESYYLEPKGSSAKVSPMQMCETGGDYYVKTVGGSSSSTTTSTDGTVRVSSDVDASGAWKKVNVQKGVLVSATALSSFAGRVIMREI